MKNFLIVSLVTVLLTGCGSTATVPVINKSPDRYIPEAYEVKHGDSIYKIAWAFGLDYLDIAEYNNLSAPYPVTPGQALYLREPPVKTTPLDSDSTELWEPETVTKLPAKAPSIQRPTAPEEAKTVTFSQAPSQWNWPAEGKLIGRYSPDEGSNGIQIAGLDGSAVKATADGEVVYVGQGIRGYGQLIIVKHSDEFLSAYAHNQTIMVDEGQVVGAGQQIGTMGSSGTQSTKLHFEIRKDGKPVDPLNYLN